MLVYWDETFYEKIRVIKYLLKSFIFKEIFASTLIVDQLLFLNLEGQDNEFMINLIFRNQEK